MKDVFITSAGIFLPNNPISNDEMEDYLGKLNGKDSIVKARILKQNGIKMHGVFGKQNLASGKVV